ncbi:MAG TPA: DUF6807 family protein [Pirellulales bacterium]|jgi:hypothetical protein|nr:DUF6807 family protein [Pirellulales bacterium]
MHDRRRIRVTPEGDEDEFLVTIDLELFVDKRPVTLGKTPFGFLGVRMAKTLGVKDGGGRILNSEGAVNEKEVFWKPARWCDYAGQIAPEAMEGITLFDHPSNPNYPTVFHVRDDGWMGAALTFAGPMEITEKPIHLRYGLYIHAGILGVAEIDPVWSKFAADKPPETLAPPPKKKS